MVVYGENEDYHCLCFFVLFVVMYFVFCFDGLFMEKFATENRVFLASLKEAEKMRFCVAIFSMNNPSKQKNKIHHDKEHEEMKTMVFIIFSIDNQNVV